MTRDELREYLVEHEDFRGRELYIWGTGNTAVLYQEGISRLSDDVFKLKGYIDSNKNKWGTEFYGKTVYEPSYLLGRENVLVLIASPQPKVILAISNQLREMSVDYRHIDDYILKSHGDEVMRAYELFDDDYSRELYKELIVKRIEGAYPSDDFVSEGQYFGFKNIVPYEKREVVVDCGAYVGDSLERYIYKSEGQIGKYIAFEPDINNYNAMLHRAERLKREWNIGDDRLEIYPYAVGDEDKKLYVARYDNDNGLGTKVTDCNTVSDEVVEACCVSIDQFIDYRIDLIKADVESYEYKVLLGAKTTIAKWKPKLAICIYHNAVDLYQIPLLISSIFGGYKMSIRHYTNKLSETVLYAYVDED